MPATPPAPGPLFPRHVARPSAYGFVWTDMNQQWAGSDWRYMDAYRTNHYDAATDYPAGSHMGYVDGSAVWVSADQVEYRIDYSQNRFYW